MSLIGNRNSLAFEFTPVIPTWELRYAPERAAWAGLAIWAGGRNLCRHVSPGSNELREALFVPLGPVVDWLVRAFPAIEFEERAALFPTTRHLHQDADRWGSAPPPEAVTDDEWVDAREEWWTRHFLGAGAEGARLPNVAFVRDDEHLVVTWSAPRFLSSDAPTLFFEEGESAVAWYQGRTVLEQLAAEVAAWLREQGAGDVYPWAVAQQPLAADPLTITDRLGLFTGRGVAALQALFNVSGVDELLRSLALDRRADDPAASPQCQILRDLSPAATPELGREVSATGEQSTRQDPVSLSRWRSARATALDAARSATSPVQEGCLAAHELRRSMGLDGQPIGRLHDLTDAVGLSYRHSEVRGHLDRMLIAAREGGSPSAVTLHTPRTARPWGQRFEAARAVGHLLLDPMRSGSLGAASGPFGQETRHRRSGAFAAELLLPEAAIARASGGRLDGAAEAWVFEELMERYGIGARATAYQLWNRGWLSSPDVRDELIDRFARTEG
jgi:hypothetical protein